MNIDIARSVNLEAHQILRRIQDESPEDTTIVRRQIKSLRRRLNRCRPSTTKSKERTESSGYMGWLSSSKACKERQLRSTVTRRQLVSN